MMVRMPAVCLVACFLAAPASAQPKKPLQLMDVFALEHASDPQISPDGKRVVYVRNFMDVMKDKRRSNLWIVNVNGTNHQALTTGNYSDSSPRFSPDGNRLLFVSDRSGTAQLHCLWLDTGRTAQLTRLTFPPVGPAWSPNGKQIAFASFVKETPRPFVELPAKPDSAEWAAPFKVIEDVHYRFDGKGYLKQGHYQLFVLAADGGAARQVTSGPHHHAASFWSVEGPEWAADGAGLIFTANRDKEVDHQPLETEIFAVTLTDGKIKQLTDRRGPDHSPAVSPDGKHIAYVGFDDKKQGHQNTLLHIMNRDGTMSRALTKGLDRSVRAPIWASDSSGVYFLYDDSGVTKIGHAALSGKVTMLVTNVGGEVLDRPYAAGSFSVSKDGTFAYTRTTPTQPAHVGLAVSTSVESDGRLSWGRPVELNADLLAAREVADAEEIWFESSHDKRKIQGWIVKPPNFDPKKKYPLILEIHGGPFANYGPRFALDMQLYAAAGYVVLYINPRGSTSYGEEFGNLIHHAYPGHDYDDLMSGIDALLRRGYVDANRLFITGGSGGGVLTAWSIGKTRRFRAAVVGKPVINWHSFVLTADAYPFFAQYWFPGPPWEMPEHYHKRSPLSLVGKVTTPTMLLTGEEDHRTPMAQSEEYYQALKLRKVPAALVRVPGASHGIGERPSHLMAKAAHVLRWFQMHDVK